AGRARRRLAHPLRWEWRARAISRAGLDLQSAGLVPPGRRGRLQPRSRLWASTRAGRGDLDRSLERGAPPAERRRRGRRMDPVDLILLLLKFATLIHRVRWVEG